jgi:hypothetical protein
MLGSRKALPTPAAPNQIKCAKNMLRYPLLSPVPLFEIIGFYSKENADDLHFGIKCNLEVSKGTLRA